MKKYLLLIMSVAFVSFFILWNVGSRLTAPLNSSIGEPPDELNAKAVVFNGVHGWFVPAKANDNCILLIHGIRANRRAMIARAQFLKKAGYPSFLIDLQAHGETPGENITFGYLESESASAAIDYLHSQENCQKVAAIGQSLGGAASLLGQAPLNVDAYILESVYPTIEDAVYNRLQARIGILANLIAPLLYYQIPMRLGISLTALRPAEAIKNVKAPVMIISGIKDNYTTSQNSRWLFSNVPTAKEFWQIDQAGHTDFYQFIPEQYEHRILTFLSKYLV